MNQRQMRNRIRILESTIAALEYFAEEVKTGQALQLDDESLMRLVGAGQHLDEAYKAHRMVPKACRPVGVGWPDDQSSRRPQVGSDQAFAPTENGSPGGSAPLLGRV